MKMSDKENVLHISIQKLTENLNELISECIDDNGKLKQPSHKAIMRARGCLPKQYSNSLIKNK